MSNSLKSILIFAVGAAIGSVATWKFVESKYSKLADDEIAEVRDYYRKKYSNLDSENKETKDDISEPSVEERAAEVIKLARKNGYVNYSEMSDKPDEPEQEVCDNEYIVPDGPYQITPEEFDTIDGYTVISLTHYSDKVVADEDNDRVVNINDLIGEDTLSEIGTIGSDGDIIDAVYARNDKLKADYEILYDHRTYASVVNRKPHHVE